MVQLVPDPPSASTGVEVSGAVSGSEERVKRVKKESIGVLRGRWFCELFCSLSFACGCWMECRLFLSLLYVCFTMAGSISDITLSQEQQ